MTGEGKNCGLDMKRRYWAGHISAWKDGDLSQVEYCRRQGIGIKSFQYWKSKFDRHEEIKLVPVPAVMASGRKLLEVVQTGKSVVPLVLHIGERYRLDIGKDFDEETFCRVIGLL